MCDLFQYEADLFFFSQVEDKEVINPVGASWVYARKRWTSWPPRQFRQHADFMMNA